MANSLNVPPTRALRGPLPTSCDSCRLRRVGCKRKPPMDTEATGSEPQACEACVKKGIKCTTTAVKQAQTRGRSGKRIETAKELYGSLVTGTETTASSSNLARLTLVPVPTKTLDLSEAIGGHLLAPSSTSNTLTNAELSGSLGAQLLRLYNEAGAGAHGALYPLPIFAPEVLLERYEAVGRNLSALTSQDELLCRTVFPLASRLLPSSPSRPTSSLAHQLFQDAQGRADDLAIWRKPSRMNAIILLLLHQASGQGEISHTDTRPYMAALVEQVNQLLAIEPTAIKGISSSSTSNLGWCIGAFDALSAVESGREPRLSDREYNRIFDLSRPSLPSRFVLSLGLAADPFSLTTAVLCALALVIALARRVAYALDDLSTGGMRDTPPDAFFPNVWREMDRIYAWSGDTLDFAAEVGGNDRFSQTVLELFCSLSYGSTVFSELSILVHLEKHAVGEHTGLVQPALLQLARSRISIVICRYLRDLRKNSKDYLAIFTACAWSLSRMAMLAQLFTTTSAWNTNLHPGGAQDKLASLQFLSRALESIQRCFDTADFAVAIKSLAAEKIALEMHVCAIPEASQSIPPALARLPRNLSSQQAGAPSLTEFSTWTYTSDEATRTPSDSPPTGSGSSQRQQPDASAAVSQVQTDLPSASHVSLPSPINFTTIGQTFSTSSEPYYVASPSFPMHHVPGSSRPRESPPIPFQESTAPLGTASFDPLVHDLPVASPNTFSATQYTPLDSFPSTHPPTPSAPSFPTPPIFPFPPTFPTPPPGVSLSPMHQPYSTLLPGSMPPFEQLAASFPTDRDFSGQYAEEGLSPSAGEGMDALDWLNNAGSMSWMARPPPPGPV
ncbi:hypothetical protein JCM11641_002626 [Rhodosporidiobolus odoratus]